MHADFIPVTEVAAKVKLSRMTAYKRLQKGEIPGLVVHFGRQRVDRQVFEKWLKNRDRV